MTITAPSPTVPAAGQIEPVGFLELEITRDCTLRCTHCYSNSGPAAGTGAMTAGDWRSVIEQAAAHPAIETVQFIGGEPTDHADFLALARHALARGLQVAVFSNLYRTDADLWELFTDRRVKLSTSWYSADPAEHERITGRPGSFEATWSNIRAARRLGIRLKVALVGVLDGQDLAGAEAMLAGLGVTTITRDTARPVGRAAPRGVATTDDDLCGMCGRGRAAIDTDGRLMPCVLGRHRSAGNVRETPLAELLDAGAWRAMVDSIHGHGMCPPADSNDCNPAL